MTPLVWRGLKCWDLVKSQKAWWDFVIIGEFIYLLPNLWLKKLLVTKTMHVPRNPQYNMHICDMGGKGGVGWGNNVYVKWHKHGMYVAQSGWGLVGWGGAITFMSTWTRMDWDLLLHFHTHVMLRSGIFSRTFTHTSCYALGSSFALAHTRHATLWDLLLHLHTHVMLRSGIFFCTCTHTRHSTLWDLLLHFHTHVMLRSGSASGI